MEAFTNDNERMVRKLLVVLCAVALFASACGGDDPGDKEAFCGQLREGRGIASPEATINPADFELLGAVAPKEIRSAVTKLANTARSLDEIGDSDLEALFAAAFDPEAETARLELFAYAENDCGIDSEGLQADAARLAAIEDVREYVTNNFGGASWADALTYRVDNDQDGLNGVTAVFRRRAIGDEALDVCRALSVYLYELHEGEGAVAVERGAQDLAMRSGPDATCEPA